MVGGPSSKKDAENEIEVSFEEVYDTELFDVNAVAFFVYHNVDDLCPSGQEEAVVGGGGGQVVNDTKNLFALFTNGYVGGCRRSGGISTVMVCKCYEQGIVSSKMSSRGRCAGLFVPVL